MKRGWLDSFSNHATTSYLSSTLLTWKWPSSWQGYDCNNFFCFQLWLPFDPLHCLVNLHEAGVDWIIHLDTDELMHPVGTSEYSLRRLLADIPEDVDMVVFPNYESSVERDDVKEPFSEVSMFKKNYDHLTKEMYFGNYKEATRGNPNYFLTYENGKSAARVQGHLRSNGAHRWHNYMKSPKEMEAIKFEGSPQVNLISLKWKWKWKMSFVLMVLIDGTTT